MMTDAGILSQFCESGSEEAFRALVERCSPMVYSACLRGLGGDSALAEDASQAVFIILAKKAGSIRDRNMLAGWLLKTAHSVTVLMKRERARRRRREARAVELKEAVRPMKDGEPVWAGAREHLNGAVASLRPRQREAVVRHFLDGKPYGEVARELECSENAVQQRISYALDKLRKFFAGRGFVIPSAALAGFLSLEAEAAGAAPAGLVDACHYAGMKSLTAAAPLPGGAAGIAKGVMKMMLWAKVKAVAAGMLAVAAIGAGVAVTQALSAAGAEGAAPNRPADPRYLEGWRMAGANPERTSWVPEEVPGKLKPEWYRPFEPYISQKVQVVAADGMLFVSTSRGLYALDAATGAERWVYPTEMPLGHSPTVINGVAYVGCFDRRLHAIDARSGRRRWVSEPAGAGFGTNPLLVEGRVIAGNRDGYLYAVSAKTGRPAWKFKTDGPVLFSAAYKDGVVYFASNDSHAYAVKAKTGKLVWKSAKLPGAGFHSWWPVAYKDRVILTGSYNTRRVGHCERGMSLHQLEQIDIYGGLDPASCRKGYAGLPGQEPGEWAKGMPTLDLSKKSPEGNGPVTEYFENKPWRRTYFVLKRQTGEEVTYDFDQDGKPEYAPFLWNGTHSSNRYPPVVGGDGVLYQAAGQRGNPWISRNSIVGWKLDTPFISVTYDGAHDEPMHLAAGGNLIYFFRCEGRDGTMGATRIAPRPGAKFPTFDWEKRHPPLLERMVQGWSYYWHIDSILPDVMTWTMDKPTVMYGMTAYCNPPIPYRGKVYYQRWNHVFCFSAAGGKKRVAPAEIAKAERTTAVVGKKVLKARLADEIKKMLEAGHLRPGWHNWGFIDQFQFQLTDNFGDYFHYPGETIVTLARALPHLPPALRGRTRAYLKREFEAYPPYQYAHIGWKDGAAREVFDLPPEALPKLASFGPQSRSSARGLTKWTFPPQANYALYRYVKVTGARGLISKARRMDQIPPDDFLAIFPPTHNAYVAGLVGTLGLAKLAGEEGPAEVRAELDRLLKLRVFTFSEGPPLPQESGPVRRVVTASLKARQASDAEILKRYGLNNFGVAHLNTSLTVSRNFMFMVPELAQYLREHALEKVRAACEEYEQVMPYWFVAKAEEGYGENTFNALFDYHSLFQAKALILKEPYEELVKYLDVPAFARGDLFYIENLCAVLEAAGRR